MKVVVFAGIVGLSLAGGFLPLQNNQFFGLPDVGDLLTDGSNAVKDISSGNYGQAIASGVDVAGDLVGEHHAAEEGTEAVEQAADGNWGNAAADGAEAVGDLTGLGPAVRDGIQTADDIANGASAGTLLGDGVTLVGDALGEHDLAADGVKAVSDLANGASGKDLLEDGVGLASDLAGQHDLGKDVNGAINAASTASNVMSNSEENFFLFMAPIDIIVGEEVIEDEFVKIPTDFLNEMF